MIIHHGLLGELSFWCVQKQACKCLVLLLTFCKHCVCKGKGHNYERKCGAKRFSFSHNYGKMTGTHNIFNMNTISHTSMEVYGLKDIEWYR